MSELRYRFSVVVGIVGLAATLGSLGAALDVALRAPEPETRDPGESAVTPRRAAPSVPGYESAEDVAFERALRDLHQDDLARSAKAAAYLESLGPDSPHAQVARAYLASYAADRDVRQARLAYVRGDMESARALMTGAIASSTTSPRAQGTWTRELERWNKVAFHLDAGREARSRKDGATARFHFERALELDGSATNAFAVEAGSELAR